MSSLAIGRSQGSSPGTYLFSVKIIVGVTRVGLCPVRGRNKTKGV